MKGFSPEPIEQTVLHIKLVESNPNSQRIGEVRGLEGSRND